MNINVEDFDFNSGLSPFSCAFGSSMTTYNPLGSTAEVLLKTDPLTKQANCIGIVDLPTNIKVKTYLFFSTNMT